LSLHSGHRSKYNSSADIMHFYQEVERRIVPCPRAGRRCLSPSGLPLERGGNNGVRMPEKRVASGRATIGEITPQFFFTMGIPLRGGRLFAESDTAGRESRGHLTRSLWPRPLPGRNALVANTLRR